MFDKWQGIGINTLIHGMDLLEQELVAFKSKFFFGLWIRG